MASKLPWTTPKVQTLYTTSSVGRLIAEYLDAGGLCVLKSGLGSLDGENNFPIRLANTNFIL